MIGPILIALQAARPGSLPLPPVEAVKDSASTLYIFGAPEICTAVQVRVAAFDGTWTQVDAAQGTYDGKRCHLATLPASSRYGTIQGGVVIAGAGTDETGAAREWILGVGDLIVYNDDLTLDGGEEYTAAAQLAAAAAQTAQGKAEDAQAAAEQAAREAEGAISRCIGGVKVNGSLLTPDEHRVVDVPVPPAPVTSVNSKTGAVTLTASDVGALGNSGAQTLNGLLNVTDSLLVGPVGAPIILNSSEPAGIGDYVIILSYLINNGRIYNYATSSYVAEVRQLARPIDYYGLLHTYSVGDLIADDHILYKVVTEFVYNGGSSWLSNVEEATVEDVLAAIRSALDTKAPLASPAFTGTPTAPNLTDKSADGQVANKKYVDDKVAGVSVTPLAGQTFDFATMQGIFAGVKACIEALGGSVTNFPAIPANE